MTNPFLGSFGPAAMMGGVPRATVSYVGSTANAVGATTFTFTDHATGTPGNRKTIVAVSGADAATAFFISDVQVGALEADVVIETAVESGSLMQAGLYIINNPSGTTATIIVTFSEAVSSAAVAVWAAYDLDSITPVDTASQFQTSSAAVVLDLDVPGDGFAIALSNCNANQTTTWVGMTERDDTNISAAHSFSAADTATVGAPLSVSSDWAGTADAIGVAASFR